MVLCSADGCALQAQADTQARPGDALTAGPVQPRIGHDPVDEVVHDSRAVVGTPKLVRAAAALSTVSSRFVRPR